MRTDNARLNPLPEWEFLGNWQESLNENGGWNAESIVETQVEKWEDFEKSLSGHGPLGISHEDPAESGRENMWAHNLLMSYAHVVGLSALGGSKLSLLDWGSGAGHYYLITKALYPDLELDYVGFDLPGLCEAGRRVLPEQTFLDSPDKCLARTYDLVMAGSSLWYDRDWRQTAGKLTASAEQYVYLTRMMYVGDSPTFAAVQRPHAYGYDTEYQCWIFNQPEFLHHMESLGTTLVREFLFGPGPPIQGAPERAHFKGFLFRVNR